MRYYLWIDGHEQGPIPVEELRRRLEQRLLPPGVLCRAEDSADWLEPGEILGFEKETQKAGREPKQGSRRRFRLWLWVGLGCGTVVGLLAWLITRTQTWAIVVASAVGLAGAVAGLIVLGLVLIWAVLWTVFPVFVFFYLQDIRDDLRELRKRTINR